MNKKFTLKHIRDDVTRTLTNLGFHPDVPALFTIWEKEAGKLAAVSSDVSIKGDILYVTLKSPVYAHELMMRKHDLMRRINGHFRYRIVRDIKQHIPRTKWKTR